MNPYSMRLWPSKKRICRYNAGGSCGRVKNRVIDAAGLQRKYSFCGNCKKSGGQRGAASPYALLTYNISVSSLRLLSLQDSSNCIFLSTLNN